ncbi:MAG: helix-turn-helix domain-containing protein [Firmicutes bacterium]|nr:helix-turn-helix domain-containing protein [Bacillota bacterium]
MTLGDKIQQLRKDKGWSQEQLSKKIGAHQRYISRYENNVCKPSADTLRKLSEVFEVSIDYLLAEEPEEDSSRGIKDKELLRWFEEANELPDYDRELIKEMIELVIIRNQVRKINMKN